MLGENHSLVSEFPNQADTIKKLAESDTEFQRKMQTYDQLDKQIRELELDNAPTDDDAMHQLKHQRATLKDELYQRLQGQ